MHGVPGIWWAEVVDPCQEDSTQWEGKQMDIWALTSEWEMREGRGG